MIVFRYDKTFDGLLTAVFDAYSRRCVPHGRSFPDALLAEGEPAPLFTAEDHTVVTDPEKSERVWRAIVKNLPKNVCNMLMYAWLSEEEGVDMRLMRYMRRVFDDRSVGGDKKDGSGTSRRSSEVWTDFSDPDVLRIKQLALKVSYEREHLMQFTRFQKGSDGPDESARTDMLDGSFGESKKSTSGASCVAGATYFAPVSPRYNVLPLAIPWFRDRFRDQKWLIYDIKRRYGFYYDLETVTEIAIEEDGPLIAGKLDEEMMAEDEKLFRTLWKSYFNSMTIKERINPRLQRRHMPRRFWTLLTEMQ